MHDGSTRQLRQRHADLAALVDQFKTPASAGTPRRLVQIYDGGAIPTGQPDKFYLTHPVELDGTEAEGGTYTATVDTDQTIAVVILGSSAAVGDLVVAHAIGGRWVAERRAPAKPIVSWCCDIVGGRDAPDSLDVSIGPLGTFNLPLVLDFSTLGLGSGAGWFTSGTLTYSAFGDCPGGSYSYAIWIQGCALYFVYPVGSTTHSCLPCAYWCPITGSGQWWTGPTPTKWYLFQHSVFDYLGLNCDSGLPWSFETTFTMGVICNEHMIILGQDLCNGSGTYDLSVSVSQP
jgi:hypothetical protein